jgi:alkylhydroperoxidase family enzyme
VLTAACTRNQNERVALAFARKVVETRDDVADSDVERLNQAGCTWRGGRVVTNVALNIFSNYFNHVAGTESNAPPAANLAAS